MADVAGALGKKDPSEPITRREMGAILGEVSISLRMILILSLNAKYVGGNESESKKIADDLSKSIDDLWDARNALYGE